MVNKIYTCTGDKGKTTLLGGSRISKADPQIALYGGVDELDSWIGLCATYVEDEALKAYLHLVQENLFKIASICAAENFNSKKYQLLSIEEQDILNLENSIDKVTKTLPELKEFIRTGGSIQSAHFHVARTICRRVERSMVSFTAVGSSIPENILIYINRLSDFLFVIARLKSD